MHFFCFQGFGRAVAISKQYVPNSQLQNHLNGKNIHFLRFIKQADTARRNAWITARHAELMEINVGL